MTPRKGVAWLPVRHVEAEREMVCRRVACPHCGAGIGEACIYGTTLAGGLFGRMLGPFSHSKRYEVLSAQGLLSSLDEEVDYAWYRVRVGDAA